jgi:hypothetical protein
MTKTIPQGCPHENGSWINSCIVCEGGRWGVPILHVTQALIKTGRFITYRANSGSRIQPIQVPQKYNMAVIKKKNKKKLEANADLSTVPHN